MKPAEWAAARAEQRKTAETMSKLLDAQTPPEISVLRPSAADPTKSYKAGGISFFEANGEAHVSLMSRNSSYAVSLPLEVAVELFEALLKAVRG